MATTRNMNEEMTMRPTPQTRLVTPPGDKLQDARFWDDIAEKYAAKPVDNMAAFDKKTALSLARLQPHHRVLDIGCGTGSFVLRLAPHVTRAEGLDISPKMVAIANRKAQAAGATNVAFHVGTPTSRMRPNGSFDDGSFDCICAYSILHLVENREALLDQVYQWLRPGGTFIASTPCLAESWVPYPTIIKIMRVFGKAPPVWFFKKDALAQEVDAAGFIDRTEPDVGADKTISFLLATKPGTP